MTRTPEEKALLERELLIEDGLRQVLQGIVDLTPMWCPIHEQPSGNCNEDEETCELGDWVQQSGSVLTEFVLVVNYMMPNGETAFATWTAPRQQYTHSLGLLTAASDEL